MADYTPRMKTMFNEELIPRLMDELGLTNVMQVPRFEKVVINTCVGSQSDVKQALEDAKAELALITGQKPAETRAKKSIANFKLREDMPIGCRVTLRRDAMYEFLDRLVAATLPRIRDFRGISPRSFDGRGNYSMGLPDQTVFPEIELEKIKRQQGMDITIVTSAQNDEEARELLKLMGMPFAEGK